MRIVRPTPPFRLLNGSSIAISPLLINRAPTSSISSILARRHASTSTDTTTPSDPSVNPPSSTRPPHLSLPSRDPTASAVAYYFNLGKAYVTFYKTGLKAILANRRILSDRLSRLPPSDRPSLLRPRAAPSASLSRADWVLLWRVRHDVARLPLFGLVLLVCGEFTPLVVLLVDGVVPYTCRLPRQIGAGLEKAHERRLNSFQHLDYAYSGIGGNGEGGMGRKPLTRSAARTHVLRSLHLIGTAWDRVGFVPPFLWAVKGGLRMAFIEGDDLLLLRAGGVARLEAEEIKMACIDRGIDVLGRKDGELRQLLGDWLRLTAAESVEERRKRMTVLLTTRPEKWPENPKFALPDWHL